jgi:hypothetical protein
LLCALKLMTLGWEGLFILLNIIIYKMQHFFLKKITRCYPGEHHARGGHADNAGKISLFMGFLSPGGILDAFSIQGKYSVCAHFKTDRSWAQNYLPGDFEMAYRKYGRTGMGCI